MTNRIDHKDCLHEATSSARAICRKARREAEAAHEALVQALFEAMPSNDRFGIDWLLRGAAKFNTDEVQPENGRNRRQAADALISYFAPSGDQAKDDYRRRNGYIITTSASQIRSIILRSFS